MTVADPRHLPATVRFRTTLVASLLVAALLAIVSISLVLAQRAQLTGALDDTLERQAADVVAARRAGGTPATSGDDDLGWQVLAADGSRLAASGLLATVPPLPAPATNPTVSTPNPTANATAATTANRVAVPGVDDEIRLRSQVVDVENTTEVVHVAGSLEDVDDAVAVLATSLAIAVPLTVLVLAGLVWLLVGRTLRPVERIRAEVAGITGTDLHRRVPEPATDDEVGRLARTMNHMLDRVERSATTQRRFVADASHELRSPVARMRTQLEVAGADDDLATLVASLHDDTVELGDLVDGLLLLAHADDPAATRRRAAVDLDEVVLAEVGRTRRPDGVAIDVSGVSGAEVHGDRRALARVVRNLLDNAVRHATRTVVVTLREADATDQVDEAVLVVADDGDGIPADQAEAVFDRFTRLDDARARDGGGAGLGLAIVRAVVTAHGGSVAVDPDHAGARIEVRLPR